MKKTLDYILFGLILIGLVFIVWKSYTIKNKVEYITVTDTITIADTITNWQYDTVYFSHFDTVQLPAVVINDTLVQVDSVYVQIPISTYQYDTIISDTNYTTSLKATVSGFGVSFDSLYLNTKIMRQEPKNTTKWYENICPSAGVGFGTGGFGFFVGIGYKIF